MRIGPERTCVGCRQVTSPTQLVRVVRSSSIEGRAPRLRVDPRGTAPGRGAWIHPAASCLDLAIRRGGFARSFRGAVDTGHLARDLESQIPTYQGNR